ncbi:MAG: hypothetical protein N0E44_23360 [Candidatus Thiodiazotropha lotti]|nr:hypothetical protein [Candidatus Thiodiazotropha lotti]MCW4222807.1 hypothetical protein [Candidatus Thiodiazotropha lotti]
MKCENCSLPYLEGGDVCDKCQPAESPSDPAGYVAVPVRELEKLEQARKDIYEHLGEHARELMLHSLTEQMWKVANTKKWD